jgi:hypothetical protein
MRVRDGDPFVVHICRDKTFSIREIPEPVFNGSALPVVSCRTREEAESLQVATCAKQYGDHPDLPAGVPWYRLMSGDWGIFGAPEIELEDLSPIADYLQGELERIRDHE